MASLAAPADPLRAAIMRALDAFEVGNQTEDVEILLEALEYSPVEPRLRCRFCPRLFTWPGEVEGHELAAHPWELVEGDDEDVAA